MIYVNEYTKTVDGVTILPMSNTASSGDIEQFRFVRIFLSRSCGQNRLIQFFSFFLS